MVTLIRMKSLTEEVEETVRNMVSRDLERKALVIFRRDVRPALREFERRLRRLQERSRLG